MNRFKCPACGGNQYTACDTAEGCIYCGHQKLEKMDTLEPEESEVVEMKKLDIAECSEALQKELTKQKKHFEVALKIMKKWNGEGGCKYCKTPPEYLAICQNYETRIFVGISGEYLQIFDEDYPGFCDNHKINFCPICGRKLG